MAPTAGSQQKEEIENTSQTNGSSEKKKTSTEKVRSYRERLRAKERQRRKKFKKTKQTNDNPESKKTSTERVRRFRQRQLEQKLLLEQQLKTNERKQANRTNLQHGFVSEMKKTSTERVCSHRHRPRAKVRQQVTKFQKTKETNDNQESKKTSTERVRRFRQRQLEQKRLLEQQLKTNERQQEYQTILQNGFVSEMKKSSTERVRIYRQQKKARKLLNQTTNNDLEFIRSEVWEHFIEDGAKAAICKYCSSSIRINVKSNINLYYHISREHGIGINSIITGKETPQIEPGLPKVESITDLEPRIMEPLITIKEETVLNNASTTKEPGTIVNKESPDIIEVLQNPFLPSMNYMTFIPNYSSIENEPITKPMEFVKDESLEIVINEITSSPSMNNSSMLSVDNQSKQTDNVESTTTICDDDGHMLFLRSLLPLLKKFDAIQTLRVRNKFQEILMQEISSNNN